MHEVLDQERPDEVQKQDVQKVAGEIAGDGDIQIEG